MLLLLRLAARNLRRNRRRTLITLAAVAGGLALMIVTVNWANGMYQDMLRTAVASLAGHVVVQGEGYQAERDQDITVPEASEVASVLRARFPGATVVPRIFVDGLLLSPSGSVGLMATAVDPAFEPEVSEWADKVVEGTWLADDHDIVLGALAAESLAVGLGDKVVLMTQGREDVASQLFRVRGLLSTGAAEIDGSFALITVPAAQDLLELDDAVSQISVHLPDSRRSVRAAEEAAAALAGRPLEVMDWERALPEVVASVRLDANGTNLMVLVIGVIIAMGVLNTVLMSVLERVHEFGVLRAVGMKARQIRRLVLLEGLLLGVVAVIAGDLLGLLLTVPLLVWGVDLASIAGEQMSWGGVAVTTQTYAAIDWERFAIYSIVAVLLTVLASLYPAWKASRLEPVAAINHL
ncbi:MAG: ABC transporter permease [Deltaproteobacteria bacterium]|nr:ABC transporter permease [Deltaproteobacteria bacterium]